MTDEPKPLTRHPWLRITLIVVGTILILFISAGFAAGPLLRHYINGQLSQIPDYSGRVDAVSVSLLRGKYTLDGFTLRQRGHESDAPLVEFTEADVDLDYHALFHGQILADIAIDGADLTIIAPKPSPAPPVQQKAERGQDILASLVPIEVTELRVTTSRIHYVDANQNPKIDLTLSIEKLVATGLSNKPAKETGVFPAKLTARASMTGNGVVNIATEFDPLASWPHFILRVDMHHVDLPAFNAFLLAYVDADVAKGTLDLDAEMQAEKGAYSGYVKPFFKDMEFKRPSDSSKPLGKRIVKDAVSVAAKLLKNHQGQVATTAPFSGNFEKGGVQLWKTVLGLLKNGFIQALKEGFEGRLPPTPAQTPPAS